VQRGDQVLGGEHLRRPPAQRQGQRVGAHARLVPPAAGREVHPLGPAPHHPAAAGPQDRAGLVGDRGDEPGVVGDRAQLVGELEDRAAQRGLPPAGRDVVLDRGAVACGVDQRQGPAPGGHDLVAEQLVRAAAGGRQASRRHVAGPFVFQLGAPPAKGVETDHVPLSVVRPMVSTGGRHRRFAGDNAAHTP